MDKIVYEYCVLRFVPDVEREEFVNVGLMMMSKRHRWMRVGVSVDPGRVRALFPRADLARLRCQLGAFMRDDVPFPSLPVEERYRWLAAVKSAIVQTSPSHPGILITDGARPAAEELGEKFDELLRRLVGLPRAD